MKNGLRTMNIAILNPDSMEEGRTQRDIIEDLAPSKIHIEAIQETNITQYRGYLLDNDRIVTESSGKSAETGAVQGVNINNDTCKNATIYNTDRKTKKPITASNARPIQIKNANPDPRHICSERRTCRCGAKTELARSQGNTQHDM